MATIAKETKAKDVGNRRSPSPRENGNDSDLVPFRRGTMNPFAWDSFGRMVDQFFRGWGGTDRYWRWGLDVEDRDDAVLVHAEAPGFEPGDFDVQVRGDQLTLRARHKNESEEGEPGVREWDVQEYYRSLTLPASVDAGKVEAHYRNGVLDLKLPKSEEAKCQRISGIG